MSPRLTGACAKTDFANYIQTFRQHWLCILSLHLSPKLILLKGYNHKGYNSIKEYNSIKGYNNTKRYNNIKRYSMVCGIVYYKIGLKPDFVNNIGSISLFVGEDCLVFLYSIVFVIFYKHFIVILCNILYCIISNVV